MDIKIGLEIHMYLKTKQKLFCECTIPSKDSTTNSTICPVCTGQPGAKPMLPNKQAIANVLKLGLVFGSQLTQKTHFQRKHYTWPDMPIGYQKTVSGAHVTPTCVGGTFEGIGIEEIHVEEDPAAWDPQTGEVNYNRAGFPLAELVTKPEFTSTTQLAKWLQELILVSEYLGILNEEFGIKSDVNVSIKESGFSRVEIKNVNSYNGIVKAAEAEIRRQREAVANGERIAKETRRYDETTDSTQFMRSKENAQDYRFIPDPDLPNVEITEKLVSELKTKLPELPAQKRKKYANFSLSAEDVEVLVSNLYLTELFEYALSLKLKPKEVGLFLRREIPRVLNYHKTTFENLKAKNIKEEIAKMIKMLGEDKISYQTAQKTWDKLYESKFDVEKYILENGLVQVQDTEFIRELVIKALKAAPQAVADYKGGNTKALNFVVGIVMRESKSTAKPQVVNQILEEEVKKL